MRAMRTLISNQDLKRLVQGVAGVAASGLLLGAVMHPTLTNVGDKPEGPQMLLGGGGVRAGEHAADPGVGAYAGQLPDYVVGADWTRPPAAYADPPQETDQGEAVVFTSEDAPPPAIVTRAGWRDEPREPVAYPSANGGATYEDDLPAPPPAPDETDAG